MSTVIPTDAVEPADVRTAHRSARAPLSVLGPPVAIVVILLVGAIFTPDLLSATNLRVILLGASFTGIAAVAMATVTISGNFVSLAISQAAMLAAVMFSALIAAGCPSGLAIIAVLAALAVTGLVQGLVVAAGLDPVITTLAAGAIAYGGVSAIAGTGAISFGAHKIGWLSDGEPLGLPLPVWVFVGVTALVSLLVHLTTVGRRILLTGANRETAVVSGVPVRVVTTVAFVVFSIGAAITGILAVSQVGGATVEFMPSLTFDAIGAILVGGLAIQGGSGSPLRAAAGAVMIALIENIMVLHSLSFGERQTVKGAIVLLVVIAMRALRGRGS